MLYRLFRWVNELRLSECVSHQHIAITTPHILTEDTPEQSVIYNSVDQREPGDDEVNVEQTS